MLLLAAFAFVSVSASAQKDSTGAYCNIFYVTSENQSILPFKDQCFIADQYSIKDPTNFKAMGPVDGSISLFDKFDWLMHLYLPTASEGQRLTIAMPQDILSKTIKTKPGTMFITLSDNRSSTRFDTPLDNVDFVTVSGSAKVLEFQPMKAGMPYPYYKLQMDLRFRQVDRTSGTPKLTGDPIRVKMVTVIEANE